MGLIFAIILGLLVAESVGDNTSNKQTKETTQESANTVVVKKPIILEVKSDPKPEPAKEEIKSKSIKEEIKSEPIKEEITPEQIKEEITPESIKKEQTKENLKPELIKKEAEETKKSVKQGTSWLKLILYILGPILLIISGKYFYNKLRNNPPTSSTSDYMRREFKEEEIQSETTEQKPAEEEVQSEITEQQPAEEEIQSETTEQQPVEDDENNKK